MFEGNDSLALQEMLQYYRWTIDVEMYFIIDKTVQLCF